MSLETCNENWGSLLLSSPVDIASCFQSRSAPRNVPVNCSFPETFLPFLNPNEQLPSSAAGSVGSLVNASGTYTESLESVMTEASESGAFDGCGEEGIL